jgi:choline kinase
MKVLILAAGFGTRLERDIKESGSYKELEGVPKPLLPVSGKPVVSYWMDMLTACPETRDEVYVVVNDANQRLFAEWARDYPAVQLVSSRCSTNETRPGAVACIQIAVDHFSVRDHLLVIGG